MHKENLRKSSQVQKNPELAPFDMEKRSFDHILPYTGSNEERFFEPKKDEIFDPRDFSVVFLASDSVTNVTSLNRVNHRRVLIFIGNGNGLVSYGKGKASEYEQAFDDAFKDARARMLCLNLEEIYTCPNILAGRHNDFKIKIYPNDHPNYWGNPTIWEMLKHTGLFHCRFVCISRKRDPYSLVYGFFNAVSKNKTPQQASMVRGIKLHRLGYIHPLTNSMDFRTYLGQ